MKLILLSSLLLLIGCSDFIIQPRPEEDKSIVHEGTLGKPDYLGEWCIANGSGICIDVKESNIDHDDGYDDIVTGKIYVIENNREFPFFILNDELVLTVTGEKTAIFHKNEHETP